MYLEEAEVKEYKRKNGTRYKQLHLGTGSKFKKAEKVSVINSDVLKDFIAKANPEFIEEMLATNESLASEKDKLEHDLQKEKEKSEELDSKLDVAKTEIFKLQEENKKLNESLTSEKDNLIKEKETSKGLLASITKLTNETKELEKENIFLKSRSLLNRIFNKQYTKEADVPEIVEAEAKESDSIPEE